MQHTANMHCLNYYATSMLLNTGITLNMKLTINILPCQHFFHYACLTFGQFPDISQFSRQVVTRNNENK